MYITILIMLITIGNPADDATISVDGLDQPSSPPGLGFPLGMLKTMRHQNRNLL